MDPNVVFSQTLAQHVGQGRPDSEYAIGSTSVCVFWEGRHFPGKNCPHGKDGLEDDIEPGWTVQQANHQERPR